MAQRWVDAFPPTEKGEVVEERKAEARELLLGNPGRLFRARRTLGSLSAIMKNLKQPIARRANEEMGGTMAPWEIAYTAVGRRRRVSSTGHPGRVPGRAGRRPGSGRTRVSRTETS